MKSIQKFTTVVAILTLSTIVFAAPENDEKGSARDLKNISQILSKDENVSIAQIENTVSSLLDSEDEKVKYSASLMSLMTPYGDVDTDVHQQDVQDFAHSLFTYALKNAQKDEKLSDKMLLLSLLSTKKALDTYKVESKDKDKDAFDSAFCALLPFKTNSKVLFGSLSKLEKEGDLPERLIPLKNAASSAADSIKDYSKRESDLMKKEDYTSLDILFKEDISASEEKLDAMIDAIK